MFDNGWDVSARLVDDVWVERIPRRNDEAPALERETLLLPWLAPQLPLAVPAPVVTSREPLRVRHRLIEGDPCSCTSSVDGRLVGHFLKALHRVDVAAAIELGIPSAQASHDTNLLTFQRFRESVIPMLDSSLRPDAAGLLDRLSVPPERPTLIHADLGPDHIRANHISITGIIDWVDACIGDPALDLSWIVFGASPKFGRAVTATYGPTGSILRRGRDWHLLGPWHEVLYGMDTDRPDLVRSGLEGVTSRLMDPTLH